MPPLLRRHDQSGETIMANNNEIRNVLIIDQKSGELKCCCDTGGNPRPLATCDCDQESIIIGIMTIRPNGGYGAAAYKKAIIGPSGNWVATGEDIPIVIPNIAGIEV